MTDMDEALARRLNDTGRCPECGSLMWWRGPQGGASVNVACASCGFAINVCMRSEQVIFVHRIPRQNFLRYGIAPEPLTLAGKIEVPG